MYTNLPTSQGYIFRILQHFATKLCSFSNFDNFFPEISFVIPRLKFFLKRKSSIILELMPLSCWHQYTNRTFSKLLIAFWAFWKVYYLLRNHGLETFTYQRSFFARVPGLGTTIDTIDAMIINMIASLFSLRILHVYRSFVTKKTRGQRNTNIRGVLPHIIIWPLYQVLVSHAWWYDRVT